MARLDVFQERGSQTLLLDCQADLLSYLKSRFVVPLEPEGLTTPVARRLNPIFEIAGRRYVMATQLAATVPIETLDKKVGAVSDDDYSVTNALDFLLTGV